MEIEFRCPHCSAVGHADWELGGPLTCPHCGHGLAAESAEGPAQTATKLERCPVCNGYEFYRQRDFNRRLGVALVILGVILAWPTRGLSLLVVALVDLALYALLPGSPSATAARRSSAASRPARGVGTSTSRPPTSTAGSGPRRRRTRSSAASGRTHRDWLGQNPQRPVRKPQYFQAIRPSLTATMPGPYTGVRMLAPLPSVSAGAIPPHAGV